MAVANDIQISIGGSLAPLQKALEGALRMMQDFGKKASEIKIPLAVDGKLLRDAINAALRDSQQLLDKARLKIPVEPGPARPGEPSAPKAPRDAPRDAPPRSKPKPDPKGVTAAEAEAAAEKRFADLRVKYQDDAGEQIVARIAALLNRKRSLQSAELSDLDAAEKKKLATQKKTLDDEMGMLRRIAAEKDAVVNKGAGAGVGQMGLFRKVQATGVLQFAAIAQSAQALAGVVDTLSQPFRKLDTEMGNIGALGVKNLGELQGAIVDFSRTVPDAADAVAAAIGEGIGSGVIKVSSDGQAAIKQGIEFARTAGQLAVAGSSSIGKAVSGIAGVLNAYGMDAEKDGQRIADSIFNIYNLGVASVDDLASFLSQVTPVAAAAGVPFEQIGAAIATMTKQGQKVPDVTTKIRAFLVELQKPAPALKKAMDASGVSIEKIAKGEMTLQDAASRLNTQIVSMGKSAPQMFSSIEAATVALSLSGKNAAVALEDLEGIAQRGTVAEGYAVQAQTAENRMKVMMNNVQAGLISLFSSIGTGATAVISGLSQIGPTIATLAGLKQILPTDLIKGLIPEGFGAKFAAMAKQAVISILSLIPGYAATSAAATGAGAAGTAAWSAILGPILPIVLGIAAVIAVFVLLYKNVEGFRRAVDGAVKAVVTAVVAVYDALAPVVSQIGELLVDVGGLIFDMIIIPFQLAWEGAKLVGEGIGATISLIVGLFGDVEGGGDMMRTVFEKVRLIIISVQVAIAGIRGAVASLKESIGGGLAALFKGDIPGAVASFTQAGDKAGEAFGRAATAKAQEELRKLRMDKGEDAQDDQNEINREKAKAEKIIALRAKMKEAVGKKDFGASNQIAQEIAALDQSLVTGTAKVTDAQGKVHEVLTLSANKLDEMTEAQKRANDEGAGDRKRAVIEGLMAEAEALKKNQDELARLKEQRGNVAAVGGDTSAMDAQIKEIEQGITEAQTRIQAKLSEGKATGIFDNLQGEAQQAFGALGKMLPEEIAAMEATAREAKIGKALQEASTIKGKLDANDGIAKLVQDYNKASTDIERANIAKAIGEQVPGAVTAYDDLGNAVAVDADKVLDLANKQNAAFSSELQSKQRGFVDGLKAQADEVGKNRDAMVTLQEKLKLATDPKEIQRLTIEYDKAKGKFQEGSQKLGELVQKGKGLGLVSGDAKEMGKQFGLSARQAKEVTVSTKDIGKAAKDAKADVAGLAEEYSKVKSEAQKAANENATAAAKLNDDIRAALKRGDKEEAKRLEGQRADARKTAREQATESKRMADNERAERIRAGLEKPDEKKNDVVEAQNFGDALVSIQSDTTNRLAEVANKGIADARTRDRAAAEKKTRDDVKAADDNLIKQKDAIAKAGKDKKPVEIRVKTVVDGKIEETVIKGADAVAKALEDAKNKQIEAIREQGLAELREIDRKAFEQQLQDEVKASQDRTKLQIDLLNDAIDALGEADEASLRRRFEKRLAILNLEQAQEIEALVSASPEYIDAYAKLQTAIAEVAAASSPEAKAAAEKRVAELHRELKQKETELATSDKRILAVIDRTNTARIGMTRELEKAIADVQEKQRLNAISDIAKREREQRRIEARKTYEEEIANIEAAERFLTQEISNQAVRRVEILNAIAAENTEVQRRMGLVMTAFTQEFEKARTDEEREAAIDRREQALEQLQREFGDLQEFERQRESLGGRQREAEATRLVGEGQAEEDYQKKRVKLYVTSTTFLEGLHKGLYAELDEARRKELERELSDLQKQRAGLLDDIRQRKVSYKDYVRTLAKTLEEENRVKQQLGVADPNFLKALLAGTFEGLKSIGAYARKQLETSTADFREKLKGAITLDAKGDLKFNDFTDSLASLKEAAVSTFGAIAGKLGEMAATGKATLGDFASAAAVIALDAASSIVTSAIPSIFAMAIGLLGPIAGPLAAVGAIALIQGLLAVAKSGLQKNLSAKGFKEGGYTGDGDPDDVAGPAHRGEFYFSQPLTRRYRALFERIHRGEEPTEILRPALARELSAEMFVDFNGRLQRFQTGVNDRLAAMSGMVVQFLSAPHFDALRTAASTTNATNANLTSAALAGLVASTLMPRPNLGTYLPRQSEPAVSGPQLIVSAVREGNELTVDVLGTKLDEIRTEVKRGNDRPVPKPAPPRNPYTAMSLH